ncbi:MAG: FKBP-type peptidyl-prolyl cis-trans isomerase [Bacteroidetes bacterium]|nr:FKBP-type peptidyl-prolyl cis-trans isomerase [Bacteroidota bacterium]
MKISKKLVFASVGAALMFSACDNSPYPGYEMSESGLYSQFYNHDEAGVTPKEGDVVKLIMSYRNSKDSILFDSKKMGRSEDGTIEFPLTKSTFKASFEEALGTMAVGDSASFKISADSVYLKTFMVQELPAYIEKGSMLTFEAKLVKITSKEEAMKEQQKRQEEQKVMMELAKNEEGKIMAKYLEDNKITAKPTASGLIYVETKKGSGSKPTAGSMVKVNYVGMLLDGTIFDTSLEDRAKEAGLYDERRPYEPFEFALGTGQVIPGWDEGIALMTPGSKGKLIIPSELAYGAQGGGPIPPFSSLVFEVELVSFSAAK